MSATVATASPDQDRARTVEELRHELNAAQRREAATAEVLRIISRSAFDLQSVLGALVASAAHLCDAPMVAIHVQRDAQLPGRARYGFPPEMVEALSKIGQVLDRGSLAGRTIAEGHAVHIPDVEADAEYTFRDFTRITGARSMLGVPLLRDGRPVGLLSLYRTRVAPFTPRQIDLMATFADQAVIAIENTRLFEIEQQHTRELKEALEQQAAASEVLELISSSAGELGPVFEAVLINAVRICDAKFANLFLYDGEAFRHVAMHGAPSVFAELRRSDPVVRPGPALKRLVLTKEPQHVPDVTTEQAYRDGDPAAVQMADVAGARTLLAVPMVKEDRLVGAIGIYRQEVRPFTQKQISLLTSFANQAIIALENTRLLNSLREALQQQTATADVLGVISRSPTDAQPVFDIIGERAEKLCEAEISVVSMTRGDTIELASIHGVNAEGVEAARRAFPMRRDDETVTARAVRAGTVVHIADVLDDAHYAMKDAALISGYRSCLGVPMMREGQVIGAIFVARAQAGLFSDAQVQLLKTFADQAVIAIENTRLFEEIAQKSRELEIASQHKSQFVANMSHELRTPLAAILGYAELIQEGFYGPLPEKSMDALTRIRSNGKHLLGLINTVLDIAKIESGQFTLNIGEYALESVVETVRAATESLAAAKNLALKTEVAKRMPLGLGDEQRLTQVLLNLVGNALKFTDAGEVRIIAMPANGGFAVSVTDTGPGIPPEEQTRIFQEFHQVDSSNTKAKGGTGLGLAIAKQIVEMHGGRIWVESTFGKGSTFQVELPIRAQNDEAMA
jgi:signal transduction histidine kinase